MNETDDEKTKAFPFLEDLKNLRKANRAIYNRWLKETRETIERNRKTGHRYHDE